MAPSCAAHDNTRRLPPPRGSPTIPRVAVPPSVEIDEVELLARLGGRRDLLALLISLFAADLPQIHLDFDAALAAGDTAALRRLVHRLVGTLANLSAVPLLEYGRDLEELAIADDIAALRARIPGFLAAIDRLEERLRRISD